jgi:hypothetical protein
VGSRSTLTFELRPLQRVLRARKRGSGLAQHDGTPSAETAAEVSNFAKLPLSVFR